MTYFFRGLSSVGAAVSTGFSFSFSLLFSRRLADGVRDLDRSLGDLARSFGDFDLWPSFGDFVLPSFGDFVRSDLADGDVSSAGTGVVTGASLVEDLSGESGLSTGN